MDNKQQLEPIQKEAVKVSERLAEYRKEKAQSLVSMIKEKRAYKVSEVTGLYIHLLEELEELEDKLVLVWKYEEKKDIPNEEWEKLVTSFSHASKYITERIKGHILEQLTNREIVEI